MKSKITDYQFPEDLKNMSLQEMDLLSYAIRDFLIEKVSKTGGHLASNLGVVELTLALHKMFDSPKDKIIWDVGHQAYVHKILTGRAAEFDTLRKLDGLSGFPKGKESPHDAFDTGHSSTSISAAAGLAAARDLKGEKHEVIAVIGDGSLTGGMAYEALNNIGVSKSKVIVILNDNGMSISPNIGGISTHLGTLRTSKGYLNAKDFIKNKIGSIPSVGKGIADGLAGLKNDIKYTLLEHGGVLFEELGFTYFGPVDGHDLEALCDVLERARNLQEPVVIHVITKKGKGYLNAEKAPDKFHGIGPFDPETGELLKRSNRPTYSSVMGKTLTELAAENQDIVAITAAMGDATGLGSFAKAYPGRFFDVGIAEQHAVTFAAGLAKAGMRPVVAIYSSFLQRGYDQIIHDVCMQNLPIVFCLDRAGIVGADGETHHGVFDLAYLNAMPNMTVLAPTCDFELKEALKDALNAAGPVAIRYPRGEAARWESVYDNVMTTVHNKETYPNIRILGIGKMAQTAAQVAKKLAQRSVYALYTPVCLVNPIDPDMLATLKSGSYDLVVTIEDGVITGGYGQHLAIALKNDKIRVENFGWPDAFIPQGTFEQLAERCRLTADDITERICDIVEGKA